MADNTKIAWTEATWNPTVGCSRTSPGCDHCYAIRDGARLQHLDAYAGTITDGDWTGVVRLIPERLSKVFEWQRPRLVFVNSMSDLFHEALPVADIAEVFAVMSLAERHTFQVLTKRSKRMRDVLCSEEFASHFAAARERWAGQPVVRQSAEMGHLALPVPNVWLGVSIESSRYVFRARHLTQTPAAVRFVSAEPLIGPLEGIEIHLPEIDWVIVGGESGPQARAMDASWARELRDHCATAGTAFFFKQAGAVLARQLGATHLAGAVLDEMPEDLQIREMPSGAVVPGERLEVGAS